MENNSFASKEIFVLMKFCSIIDCCKQSLQWFMNTNTPTPPAHIPKRSFYLKFFSYKIFWQLQHYFVHPNHLYNQIIHVNTLKKIYIEFCNSLSLFKITIQKIVQSNIISNHSPNKPLESHLRLQSIIYFLNPPL